MRLIELISQLKCIKFNIFKTCFFFFFAHSGYFVHLSTVEEVREEVVHYLPVMARPLVLHQIHHPVIWTPLYADVTV